LAQVTRTRAGGLDRFLRLFADVRAGEGACVVLLAVNVFLILTAYYVLKPVREALILGEGSAELKSYMSAAQVVVLAAAVPLYGRLAGRLSRRRLINWVTGFFVICLIVFYLLARLAVPLGIVFFIWIGIFNLMIVAQFWSFANDIYTNDQGERLFPIVAFGASLGAVLGATIAGRLIGPLGVDELLLVGAALLLIEVQITNYLDRRERTGNALGETDFDRSGTLPAATSQYRMDTGELKALTDEDIARYRESEQAGPVTARAAAEGELGSGADASPSIGHGAFALVFRYRYLLLIALLMMLLNWVNTTGEYILGSVVEDAAKAAVATGTAGGLSVQQYIGKFYSDFFSVVNLAGLLIQLFLVSRIVKYLGVAVGLLILPVIALSAYTLLAFYPVLAVVRWAKTAENSTDYSLNNTVRNMLFLPTTREQKYKAKQAIDSFFWRAGDVLSAALVFVGTSLLAWKASNFAVFNIVLVVIWLGIAIAIGRRYGKLVREGHPPT
jgi:AAA family ATP:ADP antiporter